MNKILLILLFTQVVFAQDPFDYYVKMTTGYPLPTFAIDTTQTPPTPYSSSYLYFAGLPTARGQFARVLGDNDCQYGFGLKASTIDSFQVHFTAYYNTTGKLVLGKFDGGNGWFTSIGNNIGARILEWYMSGKGYIPFDTIAVGDTTWKAVDIYYWKASTTLDIYVNGTRKVHNTSYSYTANLHSWSLTMGSWGSPNSTSDTGQIGSASFFQGGIKRLQIVKYASNRDTTYDFQFSGYGQNVYCNVTSNGTYVKGWYDYDRSGYSGVAVMLASPHMTMGLFPSNDTKDPLWVNTGTAPSYIVPLGYGVRTYGASVGALMNTESYTNGECVYKTNFTGQGESTFVVIGGTFNTINQSNPVLMGDSAYYMAKYNINTGKWTSFKNTQNPSTGVHGCTQWDSSLVVAGSFTSFNGVALSRGVGRWDGTNWKSIDSGINGVGVRVRVIDDTLYLGGSFTASGSTTLNNIGRIARGGQWRTFGTGTDGIVFDVVKFQGSIYVGGLFTNANGVTVNSFGKWNGTTFEAIGRGFKLNTGAVGNIYCLTVYKNELYIGGFFDSANGVACKNLVKFDGTTFTAVANFTMGSQQADIIQMEVDSTYNHLYGVGQFTRINGHKSRAGFVYDGTNITSFHAGDMRPEGLVIANNQTASIRYFIMGDFESAYGKNLSNIFELIPTR